MGCLASQLAPGGTCLCVPALKLQWSTIPTQHPVRDPGSNFLAYLASSFFNDTFLTSMTVESTIKHTSESLQEKLYGERWGCFKSNTRMSNRGKSSVSGMGSTASHVCRFSATKQDRNPLGGTWSYLRKSVKAKPFGQPNSVVLEPSYLSRKLLSYFTSHIQYAPANGN